MREQDSIADIFQRDYGRLFATVVRLLGDFDLAEDALQEAFAAAMQQWPVEGLPDNPRAWLISAARFKGIDRIRKDSKLRLDGTNMLDAVETEAIGDSPEAAYDSSQQVEDDQLRLIFTCCHPAIAVDVQIALTLREICGLSTEAIASAFLLQPATLAQRLVRGKAKIRTAGIPYEVPDATHLSERLDSVLKVIYLVFNEGYHASAGNDLVRPDLALEAIRLGRLLLNLLPDAEVCGLLALMLLTDSRREARQSADGQIILLEHQDRQLWNQDMITEGKALLEQATASREIGVYTLQAAIAAVHADADTAEATDWHQIVALYQLLLRANPSPVVELNRAVAVSMRDGPSEGLTLVTSLMKNGDLQNYYLAHAAQADLHRRLGDTHAARAAYTRALALAQLAPDQKFLQQRLQELE